MDATSHTVGPWVLTRTGDKSQPVEIAFNGDLLARVSIKQALGEFFEAPAEDLFAGANACLVNEPVHYLVVGEGALGLENLTSGAYTVSWHSPTASQSQDQYLDGGDMEFERPDGEWTLLQLSRTSR